LRLKLLFILTSNLKVVQAALRTIFYCNAGDLHLEKVNYKVYEANRVK